MELSNHSLRFGTAGGTLCVVLANIQSGDILKTIILSATGALVSFSVSFCLKKLARWYKRTPRV
ncbi:MAG TPA: hypothetical protein VGM63_00215 [Mucilaginibacter sp.]|jgi:hypothetical protein